MSRPDLILLTGDPGSGKTPLILDLIEELIKKKRPFGAVAMKGIFRPGEGKLGFRGLRAGLLGAPGSGGITEGPVLVYKTGCPGIPSTGSEAKEDLLPLGEWLVNHRAFDQVNREVVPLLKALPGEAAVILDEIGPLELRRNEGFFPLWQEVRSRLNQGRLSLKAPLLVTVRPSLVEEVRSFFPSQEIKLVSLGDPSSIETSLKRLLDFLMLPG